MMTSKFPSLIHNARQILKLHTNLHGKNQRGVPKGHVAVYVGENHEMKRRYVIPLTYLGHPSFQDLLKCAEEEFGYNHPMGGLTIPCKEDTFIDITTRLSSH